MRRQSQLWPACAVHACIQVLLLCHFAHASEGVSCNVTVTQDGSSGYSSLSDAIYAVKTGATICVESGQYSVGSISIGKYVQIVGVPTPPSLSRPVLLGDDTTTTSVLNYDAGIRVHLYNLQFEQCTANEGGAVFAMMSEAYIDSCVFDGCTATESLNISYVNTSVKVTGGGRGGGGVLLVQPASATIVNSNFSNCIAEGVHGQGAGLSMYWEEEGSNGVTTLVENCIFVKCIAEGVGGGVLVGYSSTYSGNNAHHQFTSNVFYQCDGENGGGGGVLVYYFESKSGDNTIFSFAENTFIDCSAGDYGGGAVQFYLKTGQYGTGGIFNFVKNSYYGCLAGGFGGGAIAIVSLDTTIDQFASALISVVSIIDDMFYNCKAIPFGGVGGGGAISFIRSIANITISRSTFESCTSEGGAGGGAIAVFAPNGFSPFVIIRDSTLTGCSCTSSSGDTAAGTTGGGILSTSAYLFLIRTLFSNNMSPSGIEAKDVAMTGEGVNSVAVFFNSTFVISPQAGNSEAVYSVLLPPLPILVLPPIVEVKSDPLITTGAGPSLDATINALLETGTGTNTVMCPPGYSLYTRNGTSVSFNSLVLDTCTPGSPAGEPHSCLYESARGGVSCGPCSASFFSPLTTSLDSKKAYCRQCGFGLSCPGAAELYVKDGYWISSAVVGMFNDTLLESLPEPTRGILIEAVQSDDAFAPFLHLCPEGYCCQTTYADTSANASGSAQISTTCPAFQNGVYNDSQICHGNRTGLLCGSCRDGFTFVFGTSDCVPVEACVDSEWKLGVAIIILFGVATLYVVYLLASPERSASASFKTLTYFFNTIALIYFTPVFVGDQLSLLGRVESIVQSVVNIRIDKILEDEGTGLPFYVLCVGQLNGLGRLALYYIIPFALFLSLGVIFTIRAVQKKVVGWRIRKETSRAYARSTMGDAGAHTRWSSARDTIRRKALSRVQRMQKAELTWQQALLPALYNVIILSYSTLLDTSVRLLLCTPVYTPDLQVMRVMSYAGDERCWTENLSLGAIAVLLLGVLVVLPLVLVLWQFSHHHDTKRGWREVIGILVSSVKKQVLILLWKLSCRSGRAPRPIDVKVQGRPNSSHLASADGRERSAVANASDFIFAVEAESELVSHRHAQHRSERVPSDAGFKERMLKETSTGARALLVIERPYKKAFWWWEVIFLGRRLLLSLFYSFTHDPLTRSIIVTVLNVIFLAMHAGFSPFSSGIDNVIESVSLLLICLVSILSIVNGVFRSAAVQESTRRKSIFETIEGVEFAVIAIGAVYGLFVLIRALIVVCIRAKRRRSNIGLALRRCRSSRSSFSTSRGGERGVRAVLSRAKLIAESDNDEEREEDGGGEGEEESEGAGVGRGAGVEERRERLSTFLSGRPSAYEMETGARQNRDRRRTLDQHELRMVTADQQSPHLLIPSSTSTSTSVMTSGDFTPAQGRRQTYTPRLAPSSAKLTSLSQHLISAEEKE